MGYHDKLWAYSDQLSEYVELERIVAEMVYLLLKQKKRRQKGTDRALLLDLNDAARELEIARRRYPILDPGTPFKPLLKSRSTRQNKYGPWLP
jgi:hypothetical protein